jgi:hypothetical protein
MKRLSTMAAAVLVAACAAPPAADRYVPLEEARTGLPYSSAECLAKKLKPVGPFPASAIPAEASSKRQSGWVAVRYDLAAGVVERPVVVGSSPAGLYDAAALQHVARYRDAGKTTVAGCVTLIDVKF